MYGKAGRIGLLVPSVNTVAEPEFNQLVPDDVGLYAARMRNRRADAEDSVAMLQHVDRAADELLSAHVNVLAFTCTASSFIAGPSGEAELSRRLESAGNARSVTTSGAVFAALKHLSATRVVVATPYAEDLDDAERQFLTAKGLVVVGIGGMGIANAVDIGSVAPQETCDFARSIWREAAGNLSGDGADALFISCTNLRTIEILSPLAKELGKPVISSNSATCWAALQALGFDADRTEPVLSGNSLR